MKMRFGVIAVAIAAMLAAAAPARATLVTYTTVGTFASSGTSTSTADAGAVTVIFNGLPFQSVDAIPTTSASFGTFDTSATTAPATSPGAITDTFTLQIFQLAPVVGGPLSFVGSLSGTLSILNSTAYIQFSGPLQQTIAGPPNVTYSITSADQGVPGRLALVPPSTNLGVASLQGLVSVVPEPATLLMASIGIPMLLAFRRFRRAR